MELDNIIKEYSLKSDFELREDLIAYGINICIYLKQFYKIGTEEYNLNYTKLYNALKPLYEKAHKDLKSFKVVVNYETAKGLKLSNSWDNFEERTEEEVLKRLKLKKWHNYYNNTIIKKPKFINISITENKKIQE